MTGYEVSRTSSAYKLAVALAFVLVITTITPLFAEDSSADSVTIQLTDSQGRELGDTPFFSEELGFDTEITAGVLTYTLSGNQELNSEGEAYLKITSDLPEALFTVEITMAVSQGGELGYIGQTGIVMVTEETVLNTETSENETVRYTCLLNTDNEYKAYIKDASGQTASLRPDVMYPLIFYTAAEYRSTTEPVPATGIEFNFGLEPDSDTRILTFISMGQEVGSKTVRLTGTVGDLPEVYEEGYVLEGWYDSEGMSVTGTTPVADLHGYVITASWEEEPDPPEPEEWPKITIVEETIHNDDGSTTYRTTITTEYEDGTVNIKVTEYTQYPDGSTEEKDSEETIDPDGTKEGYSSKTTVEKHEDGSETWTTETEAVNPDGSSESYETIIDYDAEGNQTGTYEESKIVDAEGNESGYKSEIKVIRHDDGSETWITDTESNKSDGSSDSYSSVIDYDPNGKENGFTIETSNIDAEGNETNYRNETVITRHDDGSETWDVKEQTDMPDLSSEYFIRTTEYDPVGEMVSERTDATFTDKVGDAREYIVTAELIDEKEKKYRVDAILPDTTILDVNSAKRVIDEYDYVMAVVGVHSDQGVLIVPEDTMQLVLQYGYDISVTNHGEYVMLDTDVVQALAQRGGDVVLTVAKVTEDVLTPEQIIAIGDNYAVSVLLTVDDVYVHELGGTAEIIVEPGFESALVYFVDTDGELYFLGGSYDPETGRLSFEVEHFSVYMVKMEGPGPEPEPKDIDWNLWALTFTIIGIEVIVTLWWITAKRRDEP